MYLNKTKDNKKHLDYVIYEQKIGNFLWWREPDKLVQFSFL